MKQSLWLATILFVISHASFASTCTSGTLATYLALGSGGCTIGGDTVSNFQTLSGQTGATELAAASIDISTAGGSFDPSLKFVVNQNVTAGNLDEAIFTYTISGPSYATASLSLSGSSETVDGGVTDVVNFCSGGTFGPDGVDGCTGSPGSLLALDGSQNQDESAVAPAFFLNVTNDFTLDGGTAGTAKGGTFTNSFTATPEPDSLLLGGLGLVLAAYFSRRTLQQSGRKQ